MEILALACSEARLDMLADALREAFPADKVAAFCDPLLAIQYAAVHPVGLVAAECKLRVMSGAALIRTILRRYPRAYAVLIAEEEGAGLPAQACIAVPVTAEKLREAALRSWTWPLEER